MAQLISPIENKHRFIVGIDFGHGETSAAIKEIEWGVSEGLAKNEVQDIRINESSNINDKVIVSAISQNGDAEPFIGRDAFDVKQLNDGANIRVCFKTPPKDINGVNEQLMITFMKTVYGTIRKMETRLTDENHIVYIARPSGWNDEDVKERYRQMALMAGIPLGGLTSESRAAIFYAKNTPGIDFKREIEKGAIVFDLGSSTLDFTYLSDKANAIDQGYPDGASIIEKSIFKTKINSNDGVQKLLLNHPQYKDVLFFQAREIKESVFAEKKVSGIDRTFCLRTVMARDCSDYDELKNVQVEIEYENIQSMIDEIENEEHYISNLRKDMQDFQETYIKGLPVKGVFVTGGASRMGFVKKIIEEEFNLEENQVKIDPDDPSLTISRGIALLGVADAQTSVLVSKMKSTISSFANNDTMITRLRDLLSENIVNETWKVVDTTCAYWVKWGKTTNEEELKDLVENKLKDFQRNRVPVIVNNTLQSFIKDYTEEIRKSMNEIIGRYAPGREISYTGNIQLSDLSAINNSLSNLSSTISQICDSISNMLADILWAALGVFLWGVLCAPYYLYKIFRSDESKRKEKVGKVLEEKDIITFRIRNEINKELSNNAKFKDSVADSLNNYFNTLIETNLQQVIIPIE